jgi:hypothetical protein
MLWLIFKLRFGTYEMRRAAAEALGRAGNRQAVGALIRTFQNDGRIGVQVPVLTALSAIDNSAAIPLATTILKANRQGEQVREAAIIILEKAGDERAAEGLFAALNLWTEPGARRLAVQVIGKLRFKDALAPLLSLALERNYIKGYDFALFRECMTALDAISPDWGLSKNDIHDHIQELILRVKAENHQTINYGVPGRPRDDTPMYGMSHSIDALEAFLKHHATRMMEQDLRTLADLGELYVTSQTDDSLSDDAYERIMFGDKGFLREASLKELARRGLKL